MLEWNPNVGVSLFLFGDRIAPYLSAIGFEEFLDEYNETLSWEVYGWSKPELRILVEDDKIVSVACYDECWYRGINLIGADIATAWNVSGRIPKTILMNLILMMEFRLSLNSMRSGRSYGLRKEL